jgi:hypothetical protein
MLATLLTSKLHFLRIVLTFNLVAHGSNKLCCSQFLGNQRNELIIRVALM